MKDYLQTTLTAYSPVGYSETMTTFEASYIQASWLSSWLPSEDEDQPGRLPPDDEFQPGWLPPVGYQVSYLQTMNSSQAAWLHPDDEFQPSWLPPNDEDQPGWLPADRSKDKSGLLSADGKVSHAGQNL